MTYRPEIDGLRAVAVLSVLFYHAGFGFLPGGYVGVDIFFVISGFLITGILYEDLHAERFSLTYFYERRIRRILPVLLVVWLFSVVMGAVLMLPSELLDLGKSLTSSALFVSNVFFYYTSGYFDAPADSKPLLHTWSLSVEEQFYLFWPIVLWLVYRVRRRIPIWLVLAAVSIASLALAERWLEWSPSRAFYLLPSRAWELALGALLAVYGHVVRVRKGALELVSIIGAGLIIASLAMLSSKSRFPGVAAAPACIGAGLIVWSGIQGRPWVVRVLSFSPVVLIGLASYSLYLWHWPVLVYTRSVLDRPLTPQETWVVLAAIFVLSFLSLKLVETPFRRSSPGSMGDVSRARVLTAGGLGIATFALVGQIVILDAGWLWRYPEAVREMFAQAESFNPRSQGCTGTMNASKNAAVCSFGAKTNGGGYDLVVFGDSHADAFVPALEAAALKNKLFGRQVTHSGCPPILGVHVHKTGADRQASEFCTKLQREMIAFAERNPKLRLVVLVARWDLYSEGSVAPGEDHFPTFLTDDLNQEENKKNTQEVLARHLTETVEYFVSRGSRILLVGGVPPLGVSKLRCVVRGRMSGGDFSDCSPAAASSLPRLAFSNRLIEDLSARYPNVGTFLPSEVLCDKDVCHVANESLYYYSDDNHLNQRGAEYLAGFFDLPITPVH
jgi:peptidoglycan/LPS O-acetylase OafA/YrhL